MSRFGQFLQIAGLIIAPLGMVHFFTAGAFIPESSLMAWELGCLMVGALSFVVGKRLSRGN